MKARIHSLESFGTVDGPGIRFVTFLQGCFLRCQYCHNPDTWQVDASSKYLLSPEELCKETMLYYDYIKRGGVTLSGGEPLVQAEFAREYFKLCKQNNLHTALDTAGSIINEKTLSVLDYTDLVLLDIKALDEQMAKELTGFSNQNTLRFLEILKEKGIKTWIRHVIVPGFTDNDILLKNLVDFLDDYKDIVEKIEYLPYHTLGVYKYESLNIEYKLQGVEPLKQERISFINQNFSLK